MEIVTRDFNTNITAAQEEIKVFNRNNSQSTLTAMTVTMLNGQSPYRMVRQTLSEINTRMAALMEAQVKYEELTKELLDLEEKADKSAVDKAKIKLLKYSIDKTATLAKGAQVDISIMVEAKEAIEKNHNISNWTEADYEEAEKKHHIRRGFELLYRNLIELGRGKDASLEYLQQYGVHPQMALVEVKKYIQAVDEAVAKAMEDNNIMVSDDLEIFLDNMSDKYKACADLATKRIYGVKDLTNLSLMTDIDRKVLT